MFLHVQKALGPMHDLPSKVLVLSMTLKNIISLFFFKLSSSDLRNSVFSPLSSRGRSSVVYWDFRAPTENYLLFLKSRNLRIHALGSDCI